MLRNHSLRAYDALNADYCAMMCTIVTEGPVDSANLPVQSQNETTTPMDAARRLAALRTPLVKGAARYGKAVQSLTDAPATVYHALRYRDLSAVIKTCDDLVAPEVAQALPRADDATQRSFWECVDELDRLAYAVDGATPPAVPDTSAIAADINRRKGARKQNQENHDGVSFDDGRAELWKAVCDARGVPVVDDGAWSDYVRCHDGVDGATLLEEVPVLGTEPWTPEQLEHAERCAAFWRVSSMVPKDMMRGIERVAGKIIGGMEGMGADGGMDSLDLNAIRDLGREAFKGVGQSDVHSLMANMDSLLPAIEKLHKL